MTRHEFDTREGDRLALLIDADGALRLVQVWPAPFEEKDLLPRDHAYALLALAADLLRERESAREVIEAMERPRGLPFEPESEEMRIFEGGFERAKAAALAAMEKRS